MTKTRGLIAAVAILAVLQGCASPKPAAPGSDRALCNQARAQQMAGDPTWTQTVDRIADLQSAWSCLNVEIAADMGMLNGP